MLTGRTLLLFLFALAQAIAAVLIAEHWVATKSVENTSTAPVQQTPYKKVVVAAREIAQWKKLDASYLKEAEWPEDAVTSEMFTEISQVVGRVAVDTIYTGEALNTHRVLESKGGSVFSLRITENKRALTIRVNDVSGVGGFLRPGNRVDILSSTSKIPGLSSEEVRAETVVRNIKILAIDQESGNEESKPEIVRSVTLEMTPQEAESVLKADEGGTIRLALRNPSDDIQPQKPVTGMLGEAVIPPPQETAERTYTIIRGTDQRKGKCDNYTCTE